MNDKVRIVFLGGTGEVTRNIFAYEYYHDNVLSDMVVVDCGIGFSEDGKETLMPDVDYVVAHKEKVRAVLLTHGHEDHTSGLFHLFSYFKVPVYGTRLTTALAQNKLKEYNMKGDFTSVKTGKPMQIGPFTITFVHVTHSIPDAANIIIKTPVGIMFHASDFKFDWSPLDGRQTDVGTIARTGKEGILCLLSDCVRSERPGYTLSEITIEEELEIQTRKAKGAVFFTTTSSNISRIQQAVNVAVRSRRKIVIMGRSMNNNTELSSSLGYLNLPKQEIIDRKRAKKYPPNKLFYIVAGSQAQEDSALVKIATGQSRFVKIHKNDQVVFSADPIPGYEKQVGSLINILSKKRVNVVYSDINDELHVSGHGAQYDLMLMMGLARPKYVVPMGGEPRHMQQYFRLAEQMGYQEHQLFAPDENDALEFTKDGGANLIKNVGKK